MARGRGLSMTAVPARTAIFAACAAAHAALIAAFWSTAPPRLTDRPLPALVYALPAPGVGTAATDGVADTIADTPSPRRAVVDQHPRPAPLAATDDASRAAPAQRALALGNAAVAHALPVSAALPPSDPKESQAAEHVTPIAAPETADADASSASAAPAARALPPAPRRADLQLAYHRMRAAQDALRFHHAQGEHLAWLQRRVTMLLTAAAEPDAMPEGAHCTVRVVDEHLSVQCDDPGLGERLERADGDLAVFLSRLITLTAPGGAVEIAFLPAQPPVIAGL